jgi:hypothetical protein
LREEKYGADEDKKGHYIEKAKERTSQLLSQLEKGYEVRDIYEKIGLEEYILMRRRKDRVNIPASEIKQRIDMLIGFLQNYDIRIYVARQGDMLIPVGCLFRLAPQPDRGTYDKGSLIVNLSAYGGIAVERGLGLIRESLEIVHLEEEEDIVKIFAASTPLMVAITRQPIDWSEREPQ